MVIPLAATPDGWGGVLLFFAGIAVMIVAVVFIAAWIARRKG